SLLTESRLSTRRTLSTGTPAARAISVIVVMKDSLGDVAGGVSGCPHRLADLLLEVLSELGLLCRLRLGGHACGFDLLLLSRLGGTEDLRCPSPSLVQHRRRLLARLMLERLDD